MCYEIPINAKVYYKLRPNRSWQARSNLINHLARSSLISGCFFLTLAAPILIALACAVLSNSRYARVYPNCQQSSGQPTTNSSYSSSWSLHRLVAIPFDSVENLILWIDSGIAIIFVLVMAYLLNYDILLYWRHVHTKLEQIVAQINSNGRQQNKPAGVATWTTITETRLVTTMTGLEAAAAAAEAEATSSTVTTTRTTRIRRRSQAQLESDIHELQFELFDFFCQVEKADKLISDILTAAIIVWLLSSCFVAYVFVHIKSGLPSVVGAMCLLGLLVLTLASEYLLKLHKCCMKSYKLICTLIANDQSTTKARFKRVLEFYTNRNRTTYTLFQRHPYLATTYITIMGWTLSCYFLANSLFGGTGTGAASGGGGGGGSVKSVGGSLAGSLGGSQFMNERRRLGLYG